MQKIINYCNVDILDYNAPYVELKWVVDILEKKIIVNGQQPNKLIYIEKAINSALNMGGLSDNFKTRYNNILCIYTENIRKKLSALCNTVEKSVVAAIHLILTDKIGFAVDCIEHRQ